MARHDVYRNPRKDTVCRVPYLFDVASMMPLFQPPSGAICYVRARDCNSRSLAYFIMLF